MPESDKCQRCQLFSGYLGRGYLVCGIHPLGPTELPCPDFAAVVDEWEPLGGAYYNGELIRDSSGYLTTEERLELIETHPLFTGVCPSCGARFSDGTLIHYDCKKCGWRDDSVV
ncbi:MAG: hypothetical protein HC851_18740 [Acaryochloris sp. RU_4_1]|nr:hypothetical protein [Acaryochloris sp. RU_4_1]NJR57056.1 hypothetical protein [Acaryochloris sp. CRU_2_0]